MTEIQSLYSFVQKRKLHFLSTGLVTDLFSLRGLPAHVCPTATFIKDERLQRPMQRILHVLQAQDILNCLEYCQACFAARRISKPFISMLHWLHYFVSLLLRQRQTSQNPRNSLNRSRTPHQRSVEANHLGYIWKYVHSFSKATVICSAQGCTQWASVKTKSPHFATSLPRREATPVC